MRSARHEAPAAPVAAAPPAILARGLPSELSTHRATHAGGHLRAVLVRSQMQNDEIVKSAAFKLSEAAKRIDTLAGHASSAPLQEWLRALALRLYAEERNLRGIAADHGNGAGRGTRTVQES